MTDKKRWDTGPPDQSDIRITLVLRGEEAAEFRRWQHRNNITVPVAGKILILRGLQRVGILPDWWKVK